MFEDLHWSDEATLALLGELLPAVEQAAICFVLIHRSDPDHPAWQLVDRARRRFRDNFRELALEPLADADGRALAETEAGGELPEELAQLLAERAGGNPYFVGEAVRDLRERGVLEGRDGSLVLTGEVSVPGAIQEALQARLDRLDGDARELITTASVIGRSFGLPLLERVLPRTRLVPTLSDLVWLQLVVEERGGAAPEFRFRHGLVQEVAYGTLLESRRRELHLRVAEALLELHSDSPAEVYGLLALHFAAADEPERAGEYLLKAGDAARAVYADEEAIELYGRALAFMERTGDEVRARETLLRIGLMHHLTFDFRAANEAFGEAFALPMPAPTQLEPDERLAQAMGTGWGAVAPGHGYARPGWEIGMNLFRGLVEIGRDLDINPDLAERFTVSDDGCLYRFTIRSDACWSDGAPVTADDFESTFAWMAEDDVPTAFWLDGMQRDRARPAHARDPARRAARPLPLHVGGATALRLAAPCPRAGGARLAPHAPAGRERPVRSHHARRRPPARTRSCSRVVRRPGERGQGDDRARCDGVRLLGNAGNGRKSMSSTSRSLLASRSTSRWW